MKIKLTFIIASFAIFVNAYASNNICMKIPETIDQKNLSIGEIAHYYMQPKIETDIEKIQNKMDQFKEKYEVIKYGVESMENLYDTQNPEMFYNDMNKCLGFREFLLGGKMLIGVACEVVKSLSIFHPESKSFGESLIGLYMAKAVIFGVDSLVSVNAKKSSLDVIEAFQVEPGKLNEISEFTAQIPESVNDILKISKLIISKAKKLEFDDDTEKKKFQRLVNLSSKIDSAGVVKKVFAIGGKIISFLTGTASGISIAISGQTSIPSYYLTLIAGGVDAFVDNMSINEKNPLMQQYATISEVTYLCDYFMRKLPGFSEA